MAHVITAGLNTVAITREEREFFVGLGSRIAALRREAHTTQVQLAQTLQQHIERIRQLPKAKQRFVIQVLESGLAQASR